MANQHTTNHTSEGRILGTELSETELEKATGAGAKNAHEFPTETVSLNYGKIKWTYTQQD